MQRFIALLLVMLLPVSAWANAADDQHIKAGFGFAHKKMWDAAIGAAKAGHSPVLEKYFTWESLKDPESGASFDSITDFMEDNPTWPDQLALQKRAEVALLSGNPSDDALAAWFNKHPPLTSIARIRNAKDSTSLNALIRDAWVNDDYDKDTETKLLAKYHSILRPEDHTRRVDRLLWEGHNDEAKRLLKYVPYDHQRLFDARMSLIEDKQRAPIDLVNVPPALRNDPGLIYARLLWRIRSGDKDGVRELLLAAPEEVPYPEKWWPMRDRQIREALGEGNTKLATRLLEHHGQKTDSLPYKEVQWLSGWIALEYLHQPDKAYDNFMWLNKTVQTPAGKARSAYWTARSLEDAHKPNAKEWYSNAAHYPTTFYGQIATSELTEHASITLPTYGDPTPEEKERFHKREMVQLVEVLGKAHETDAAGKFILYLTENAESSGETLLATELGHDVDRVDYGVRAAKKALQSDVIALKSGWPTIHFVHTNGVEVPLLLALSRQESEFYPDAESPSGAIGLMQLLPGTAKEIARKNSIKFSADKLYTPDYNMTIGSLYLGKLIDKFNGSYVLAIASYNAGPGRINQWLEMYGKPGGNVRDTLDWVERIPTPETRNYVQHVLENVQVYRYILAKKSSAPLTIEQDLLRQ